MAVLIVSIPSQQVVWEIEDDEYELDIEELEEHYDSWISDYLTSIDYEVTKENK